MNNKIEYVKYEEDLCFKCLQKKSNINTYELKNRGYGSNYDNENTKLQLCNECVGGIDECNELETWFNEDATVSEYIELYQYEDNIKQYIAALPIQGREIFENQLSNTWIEDSQIWIDKELGLIKEEEMDFNDSWMDKIKDCTYERIELNKNDVLVMRYPVDELGNPIIDPNLISIHYEGAKKLFPNNKIWAIADNIKFMVVTEEEDI